MNVQRGARLAGSVSGPTAKTKATPPGVASRISRDPVRAGGFLLVPRFLIRC